MKKQRYLDATTANEGIHAGISPPGPGRPIDRGGNASLYELGGQVDDRVAGLIARGTGPQQALCRVAAGLGLDVPEVRTAVRFKEAVDQVAANVGEEARREVPADYPHLSPGRVVKPGLTHPEEQPYTAAMDRPPAARFRGPRGPPRAPCHGAHQGHLDLQIDTPARVVSPKKHELIAINEDLNPYSERNPMTPDQKMAYRRVKAWTRLASTAFKQLRNELCNMPVDVLSCEELRAAVKRKLAALIEKAEDLSQTFEEGMGFDGDDLDFPGEFGGPLPTSHAGVRADTVFPVPPPLTVKEKLRRLQESMQRQRGVATTGDAGDAEDLD